MAEKRSGMTAGIKTITPVILGLILLFVGASVAAKAFSVLNGPAALSDTYWTDIEGGSVVYADDLSLIDPFLYADSASGRTAFCLASFPDASGDMCIGVLQIPEDDGLYNFLNSYLEDENASVGTYAAKGYFSVTGADSLGAEFGAAYTKACADYADLFAEGSRMNYNGSVRVTDLIFRYRCGSDENYLCAQGAGNTVEGIIGVVIALAGLAGIAYSFAVMIKIRKGSV